MRNKHNVSMNIYTESANIFTEQNKLSRNIDINIYHSEIRTDIAIAVGIIFVNRVNKSFAFRWLCLGANIAYLFQAHSTVEQSCPLVRHDINCVA